MSKAEAKPEAGDAPLEQMKALTITNKDTNVEEKVKNI
jgi:hypothetical protein